jgi:ribosome-binding factor A
MELMAGTNPRAVRIAALIQRVIASSVEGHLHDARLSNVTITEVRVTNDLQIANVYWTQLGREGHEEGERKRAQQALNQARGRLRTLVGSKAGLRLTPQLRFIYDEVPGEATEIEDILTVTRRRDAELARLRENASFAGEADPYRHDDDPERESQAADSDFAADADDAAPSEPADIADNLKQSGQDSASRSEDQEASSSDAGHGTDGK